MSLEEDETTTVSQQEEQAVPVETSTTKEEVDYLRNAEEAFSAKFAEVTGGVMAGASATMRPVTLVVLCAPDVKTSSGSQESNGGEDGTASSSSSHKFAFGDTLNAYLERRVQVAAGLHLNLTDEGVEAGKLLQRWVIEGPSEEVTEEASQDIRQPDGSTVQVKRTVQRKIPSSLPYALVSCGGLPDTVIVQAYFTGTQGGFEHPSSPDAAGTATERGAAEADRWVQHVRSEITTATGQPPVTVMYRPGFEEQLSEYQIIPARMKQKAFAEVRGQKAGFITEFCFDEVNQLPWLRPITLMEGGNKDEDSITSEEYVLQYLQSLPSLKGFVKAEEPLVEYVPGSNGRTTNLPGKAIRQARRMKESFVVANESNTTTDATEEEEQEGKERTEEGLNEGEEASAPSPEQEQTRRVQDDDEEVAQEGDEQQDTSATGGGGGVDDSSFSIQSRAKVAALNPVAVKVEAGQTYYWCTCGHSKNQPWCDGSHVAVNEQEGSEFKPIVWTAEASEEKYFCQCKNTKNPPFCDGTHASLEGESEQVTETKVEEEPRKAVEDDEEAEFEH